MLAAVEEQVRTATILDTTEVTNPKLADVLTKGVHCFACLACSQSPLSPPSRRPLFG